MYVTPLQLAERPGARELAQVATRERDAIVDDALMDATLRGDDRSSWPADQVAIADDALARIQDAIDEAGGIIDGYVAKRYTLPLTRTFPVLTAWARAIARYLLHKDRHSLETDDTIVRDYRDALKSLQFVASGQFSLGANDPGLTDPQDGDVQFVPGTKIFGRCRGRRWP
jgi:phage gp36-like protein